MRYLSLFLAIFITLNASSIDKKIEESEKSLQENVSQERRIDTNLKKLSESIKIEQTKIANLNAQISKVEREIAEQKDEVTKKERDLQDRESVQSELIKQRQDIEREIIDIFAKELSFSLITNKDEPSGVEDIINEELFLTLSKGAKRSIKELQEQHLELSSEIVDIKNEIDGIKNIIKSAQNKKIELDGLIKEEKQSLLALKKDKERYRSRFLSIQKQNSELTKILSELKLLKKEEEERRAREQKELEERLAKSRDIKPKDSDVDAINVRQVGTSYSDIPTTKYRGPKTIAPLESFIVTKEFGPYHDPIYNLKVFNDSITLNPNSEGAHVKSVLDGKVIFAKETPVLKKVVIIEHKDNLHTIYANLDKIAPTIKSGALVKKGYVIGRVDRELSFEVTRKNRHINPLELIAIN